MTSDSKAGSVNGEATGAKLFGIGNKNASARLTPEFLVFKGHAKTFDDQPASPLSTFVFARRILRSVSLTPNVISGISVPNGGSLRVILEGHTAPLTPVVVYEIDAADYAELESVVSRMDS